MNFLRTSYKYRPMPDSPLHNALNERERRYNLFMNHAKRTLYAIVTASAEPGYVFTSALPHSLWVSGRIKHTDTECNNVHNKLIPIKSHCTYIVTKWALGCGIPAPIAPGCRLKFKQPRAHLLHHICIGAIFHD